MPMSAAWRSRKSKRYLIAMGGDVSLETGKTTLKRSLTYG